MGFSPRMYEVHVWSYDEDEDGFYWEPMWIFDTYEQASARFNLYYADGAGSDVRIVETKIVKAFEDGKLYS